MDEILREVYAAPRVVLITSPSKLQFFVVAEKQVLGEYPCLQDALFFLLRLTMCIIWSIRHKSKTCCIFSKILSSSIRILMIHLEVAHT